MKKSVKIIVAVCVALVVCASVIAVGFLKSQDTTEPTTTYPLPTTTIPTTVLATSSWIDLSAIYSDLATESDTSDPTASDTSTLPTAPETYIPPQTVYVYVDPFSTNPPATAPATEPTMTAAPETTKESKNILLDYDYEKTTDGTVRLTKYYGSKSALFIPSTIVENGQKITVSEIGQKCFHGNKSLLSVYIPDTVTLIDNDAFTSCPNLKNVNIESKNIQIRPAAFDSKEINKDITFNISADNSRVRNYLIQYGYIEDDSLLVPGN